MNWDKLKFKFADDYESSIIVSEVLSREDLKELFNMFLNEQRKKKIYRLIKSGIRHPLEIPKFLKEEISRSLKVRKNVKRRKPTENLEKREAS